MALPKSLERARWRNRLIGWLPFVADLNEARWIRNYARQWRERGWTCEPAPFFVRRAMILAEARAIGARALVETGTLFGDTPWHFRNTFAAIHTIEVDAELAALARERFRKWPHIRVLEGDSAAELPALCRGLKEACVIYLDGHYSHGITSMGDEECPVLKELRGIFENLGEPFRIVIDDARLFGTHPAYPAPEIIRRFLEDNGWNSRITIENDAILIRPDTR